MRTRIPVALLLGAALFTGACSQVQQVIDDASERVNEVVETARYCAAALRLADAVSDRDVDAAVSAGRDLVEVAPDEIAADAQLLLAAAEEAQAGDLERLQEQEVVDAAERVRTFTEDTCNPGS
jgi:malonyl CoA-acyl carrier protein transacylase